MVNGHQKANWGKNWIYKEKKKELPNLVVCVYIYILYIGKCYLALPGAG